ncbi:MAG: ABC transporter ATP-binding protein [Candidatus Hydrogenedentes bacterium]|nr:ABC transporter ATP-binding protein [Candidatus Hydrogenedentota bacterium]
MDAVIEARDLVKAYTLGGATVRALNGVSLTVGRGEMVAVTGASGSGKSTLMHILGCLGSPDSGSYLLGGEDVSLLTGNRLAQIRNRYIGLVFQTFNLLPRLSALENVELPLLYAGAAGARRRAASALESVGLSDRMHHEPARMSGGQRQRVAIARAIVTDPMVLFADEPTGALDTKTGREIMEVFDGLHRDGRTLVMITHDPRIAGACGRRIELEDGRILSDVRDGKG